MEPEQNGGISAILRTAYRGKKDQCYRWKAYIPKGYLWGLDPDPPDVDNPK